MTRLASRSWSGSRWTRTVRNDAIAAGVGFGLAALGCYAPGVPLCLALAGLVPIAMSKRKKRRFVIALGWHAAPALPAAVGLWNLGEGTLGPAILLLGWWLATAAVFARVNTGRGRGTHPVVALAYRIGGFGSGRPLARHRLRRPGTDDPDAGWSERGGDEPGTSSGGRYRRQSRGYGLEHVHPCPAERLCGEVHHAATGPDLGKTGSRIDGGTARPPRRCPDHGGKRHRST